MTRTIGIALLLCACGARSGLEQIHEDRADAAPVRDADARDVFEVDVEVDADVPDCPCTGAALLSSVSSSPTAIAVDRTHVYYATSGSGCTDGTIERVPKCGGPVEVLAADEPNPRAIALDAERVYYYDSCSSGLLRSVPKAGGPIRDYTISVSDSGRALAVGGDNIYFSDYGLLRMPTAGGTQTVINDADYVYMVAADERGAYWLGPIGGGPTFGVFAYRRGETGSTRLATPSSVGNAIAIDDDTIFFSASSGIARMPREGGAITNVAASSTSWRIAVDARFVYWTVGFAGSGGYTVNKAPKSGGESTVIGSGDGAYVDIAVDENCAYVADLYGNEIRSFPTSG